MFVSKEAQPSIKKVCITGPECTGKSALAKFLAQHYATCWIPEYARAYLDKLGHPYVESDLVKIAHGQLRMEDEWLREANQVMICDTNLLTIKIWSEYKFGRCDADLVKQLHTRPYDLYLLCYIDVPWENDPQREHPDKREHFWQVYKNETINTGVPYVEIKGDRTTRQQLAVTAIDNLLS